MKFRSIAIALSATFAAAAQAQSVPLQPKLSGLSFLVGRWSNGDGEIGDSGGRSTGTSAITSEAGGGVLLRRDHTNLFDASGKPTDGFDQIMVIYPEAGTIHADYFDGSHIIHYTSATVRPGRSVVFTSAARPGAPMFRLAYELSPQNVLSVSFSMAPPGGAAFHSIAIGTLTRAG